MLQLNDKTYRNQRQNSKNISNNFEYLNHSGDHCVPSDENFKGVGCRSEHSSDFKCILAKLFSFQIISNSVIFFIFFQSCQLVAWQGK